MVQVACGGAHSLAVDARGCVWSWGSDRHGQLGHGKSMRSKAVSHEPRRLTALHHRPVRAVAAGNDHSLALTNTLRLFSWGSGWCV